MIEDGHPCCEWTPLLATVTNKTYDGWKKTLGDKKTSDPHIVDG